MSFTPKPLVLIVLDGWGYREDTQYNAIAAARKPTWDALWKQHPHTLIHASEAAVGLPSSQMGNSEVGHLNLGAGRVVYQEYTRINRAISTGTFFTNKTLTDAIDLALKTGKAVHILGLLSPGGVHSHEEHIHAVVELAAKRGGQPDNHTDHGQAHALENHHATDLIGFGTEGHPDADLPRALFDRVRHEPVDANGGKQQGRRTEHGHQQDVEALPGDRARDDFLHGPHVGHRQAARLSQLLLNRTAVAVRTASAAKAIPATRKNGPMFGLGRACVSGMTMSSASALVAGYSFARADVVTCNAARACVSDTPGLRRPSTHN